MVMNLKWSSLAKTRRLKQTLVTYWLPYMIHVSNVSNWCKVDVPNSNTTTINGDLILNGMWLGVNLRMNTKMTYVHKRLNYILIIC